MTFITDIDLNDIVEVTLIIDTSFNDNVEVTFITGISFNDNVEVNKLRPGVPKLQSVIFITDSNRNDTVEEKSSVLAD